MVFPVVGYLVISACDDLTFVLPSGQARPSDQGKRFAIEHDKVLVDNYLFHGFPVLDGKTARRAGRLVV